MTLQAIIFIMCQSFPLKIIFTYLVNLWLFIAVRNSSQSQDSGACMVFLICILMSTEKKEKQA